MKNLKQMLAIIAVGIVLITGILPGYGLAAEDPSAQSRADDSIKVLEIHSFHGATPDFTVSVGIRKTNSPHWYLTWEGMPTWEALPDWSFSPTLQELELTFEFVTPDASGTGYTQVPGTEALKASQMKDRDTEEPLISANYFQYGDDSFKLYDVLMAEAPEGLSCQIAAYERGELVALSSADSPIILKPMTTSLVPVEDTQISLQRDNPASFWLEILNFNLDQSCVYALSLVTIDHDEVKLDREAFQWWRVDEDGHRINIYDSETGSATSQVRLNADTVNTILDQMGTRGALQYTVWSRANPSGASDGDLIIGPGPDAPLLTFINPNIPEDPDNPDKPDVPENGVKPTEGSGLEVIQPSGDSGGIIKTPDVTESGMDVSAFMAGLQPPDGYELKVVQGQASVNPESEGAIVATGQQVLMGTSADTNQETYEVVVPGDVLGSGTMNLSQLVRLVLAFTDKEPLEGPFERAGDLSGDGAISLVDITQEAALYRRAITEAA